MVVIVSGMSINLIKVPPFVLESIEFILGEVLKEASVVLESFYGKPHLVVISAVINMVFY